MPIWSRNCNAASFLLFLLFSNLICSSYYCIVGLEVPFLWEFGLHKAADAILIAEFWFSVLFVSFGFKHKQNGLNRNLIAVSSLLLLLSFPFLTIHIDLLPIRPSICVDALNDYSFDLLSEVQFDPSLSLDANRNTNVFSFRSCI